ncbi:LLM class flavin-dependent oxidoreductase [Occultella aeris]|uniref:Monooxygenase MoxC n=1 Tax=Occultella aeris TaxID=2761496 RepID=A0A7M4DF17_9MICO|nr:LLM class flavin-dependent oxidoreductase [Occultella aeris]VZO35510.1 Putative monooxygenase MoxC [Occultella aeris]
MTDAPTFTLALEVDADGVHPNAWRRAHHAPGELLSAARLLQVLRGAENAGFALVTIDDSLLPVDGGVPGRIDAVTRAAFASGRTTRLGLAPRVHPRAVEPFHLAAQLASLDHVSRGRGAWLVGDDELPGLARALDRTVPAGAAERTAEVRAVVATVRDLWDSWDDDAVIRDSTTGRYIDADRVRYVNARTPTFSVKGPLITPRPPQGQLVVIAPLGLVPAHDVDVTLIRAATTEDGLRAAATAGTPRSLLDLQVTLDTEDATGTQRLDALGADPEGTDRPHFVGSGAGLVLLLQDLAQAVGPTGGVRILPTVIDEDLPQLSRHVLPSLRASGLLRGPRPAATLRDTLGLDRPANRFTRPKTPAPTRQETAQELSA